MEGHALAFGAAASSYDRHRPSYPPEAVDWALGSPAGRRLRVVDLGAGTGILTRVVLGLGHEVVPVEPDAQMRAQLARSTPAVTALAGSSESIPLPDDSVDAVVAGQAYHWFDPVLAPVEIARVLRTGGTFAALWNLRDESEPWVARLTEAAYLTDHERHAQELDEAGLRAAGFAPVSRQVFRHVTTHTPQTLVELIKTRSHYLTADADGRAAIIERVRNLVATHPAVAGRDTFPLPYNTVVHRSALPH